MMILKAYSNDKALIPIMMKDDAIRIEPMMING